MGCHDMTKVAGINSGGLSFCLTFKEIRLDKSIMPIIVELIKSVL